MIDPATKAFTVRATGGLLGVLQTSCQIFPAVAPPGVDLDSIVSPLFPAIWDTGASASAISQNVVDAMGLTAIGMTKVQTADGLVDAETYLINIGLPNAVGFAGMTVTKAKLGTSCDVLIGMDVIGQGDFAVTSHGGQTVFSYQYPSQGHIDFVQKYNDAMAKKKQHGGNKAKRKKPAKGPGGKGKR